MNPLSIMFPVIVLLTFFIYIHIPQIRREKKIQRFQASITPGMYVITTGGICGQIREVQGEYVTLTISRDVHVKIMKSAIVNQQPTV